jgi:hypothetical protein
MNAPICGKSSAAVKPVISSLLGIMLFLVLVVAPSPAAAAEHRLGVGAHFWKTVDDIADDGFGDIEDEGYALVLSYRYEPGGFLFFQFDVDYYQDGFGGTTENAFSPMVMIGAGGTFYVAAGIGVTVADQFDGSVSDPFYVGRVGIEIDLLPGISIDIHANYQASAFAELENVETDATTLGALVRFSM